MAAGFLFWTSLVGLSVQQIVRKVRRASGLRPHKSAATVVDNTGEKPYFQGFNKVAHRIVRRITRRRR